MCSTALLLTLDSASVDSASVGKATLAQVHYFLSVRLSVHTKRGLPKLLFLNCYSFLKGKLEGKIMQASETALRFLR